MARRVWPEDIVIDPRWEAIRAAAGEPAPLIYRPPTEPALSILAEDDDLLILNKPALLLTVPGKLKGQDDCLESRAQAVYPRARIAHRLDRPTSGVVVMTKTMAALRDVGLQFEKRRVSKAYVARVAGRLERDEGVVDAPICGDWPNRPRQMVHFSFGKRAETAWSVIDREPDATRVRLHPVTGRTHQLRVHMAWLGHPILGDEFYAPPDIRAAADRLQLHAETLTLRHPTTGETATFTAPSPF